MSLACDERIKIKILNHLLNLMALRVAYGYLKRLQSYKSGDVEEILLNFLDTAVFLVDQKIDISDQNLAKKIRTMKRRDLKKFQSAVRKKNKFANLCQLLNFVLATIKEKTIQEELFVIAKDIYNKCNEDIAEIFDIKNGFNLERRFTENKVNFLNKLKPNLSYSARL